MSATILGEGNGGAGGGIGRQQRLRSFLLDGVWSLGWEGAWGSMF